jgi:hypothetical protein
MRYSKRLQRASDARCVGLRRGEQNMATIVGNIVLFVMFVIMILCMAMG